ncbi:L,D-transpeptidase [Spirillospora sp. NPDC052269]
MTDETMAQLPQALLIGTAATVTAAVLAAGFPSPADAFQRGGTGGQTKAAGTQVATLNTNAHRYASPGKRAKGKIRSRWFGRSSALPVIETRPGWVRVRLAQRPNGSTTWLRNEDVKLGNTPYRIVIDLSSKHLNLYKDGRRIMSAPAGVGAPDDPTPTGRFFVAFRQGPPRPNNGYGPFILVTSAHSRRISNWERSGDAVIGIHGPLGGDRAIGTRGARISHGCIRLHNRSLLRLRRVPPGTPVDVVR